MSLNKEEEEEEQLFVVILNTNYVEYIRILSLTQIYNGKRTLIDLVE